VLLYTKAVYNYKSGSHESSLSSHESSLSSHESMGKFTRKQTIKEKENKENKKREK